MFLRYAYHGKIRQTGLRVDGHIEAPNSAEAIDLLADKGIIGVYTVRPDPLPQAPKPKELPATERGSNQGPNSDAALGQIVDKLTTLIGQVEQLLSRPMQIAGPIREGGGGGGKRSGRPANNDVQNSALREIFQSNLDLRRSLTKLASAAAALRESENTPVPPPDGGGATVTETQSDDDDGTDGEQEMPRMPMNLAAHSAA